MSRKVVHQPGLSTTPSPKERQMVTQPPQMPAIPSVSAPTSDSIGIVFYSSLGFWLEIFLVL